MSQTAAYPVRTAAPDQLDQLMHITSPRSWMSLMAIAAVVVAAIAWGIVGRVQTTATGEGIFIKGGGTFGVPALAAGQLQQVVVNVGDHVKAGETIAKMRSLDNGAPQTEINVVSPYDARVLEILADRGDVLDVGTRVVSVEPDAGNLELVLFLPDTEGKQVKAGMKVQISPTTAPKATYGYLLGTVSAVSPFPASRAGMLRFLDNQDLVQRFVAGAGNTPIQVNVALTPDANTSTGYKWTSSRGPSSPITSGTLASAQIVLSEQAPASLVLPVFK